MVVDLCGLDLATCCSSADAMKAHLTPRRERGLFALAPALLLLAFLAWACDSELEDAVEDVTDGVEDAAEEVGDVLDGK